VHAGALALALGALARWRLRRCAAVGRGVRVHGRVHVHGGGEVRIGDRVVLDGARMPIELHALPGGSIVIEDDVVVGPGTSIEACASVRIGRGATLAELCKIMDNHFHRPGGDRFASTPSVPVSIGAEASLEARAIVLPGGRVGHGARVLAASVVTRPIPDGAMAAGVPATARRP
jgi:acetyltransferase-like isoleucine patch superfamily enzyme